MEKGNTTRLVDRYIQELFTKGRTYVYEGRGLENETTLTNNCIMTFKRRLSLEHPEVRYSVEYVFESGFYSYKVVLSEYKPNVTPETLISECNLSVRTKSLFADAGIITVGDVLKYSSKELVKFRNFGLKSSFELKQFLKENNIEFN